MADVIVQVQTSSPIVQVRPNTAVVQVASTSPMVMQVGVQGPAGRDGQDGSSAGAVKVPFAFGNASPKPVYLAQPNQTIFTATIVIQTPFNGSGAALQLGDAGMPDRLITASQTDPTFAAEYETNPGYTYTSETQITLTITPGEGCTQGSGYVLLEV
jgi:hypothetical protein